MKDRAFFIRKIIFIVNKNKLLYKFKVIRNFGVVMIDTGHYLTSHPRERNPEPGLNVKYIGISKIVKFDRLRILYNENNIDR